MHSLDYYKKNISLPDFLNDIGFKRAPRTTYRRPRFKHEITGQHIEVSLDRNDNYQYWDVHNISKGVKPKSIIDAVIDYYSPSADQPISFEQVRNILDNYISSENFVSPEKSNYKPYTSSGNSTPIEHYVKNLDDKLNYGFLASRGFTTEMVNNEHFKPIIKNHKKAQGDYAISNVAFMMFNKDLKISALSLRNFNFKGAVGSRTDSISASLNYSTLDNLFIGESMIDCISYYFLNEAKLENTSVRFVSSEGELTKDQLNTINLVIERQKPSGINYIFDRDIAGEKYSLKTTSHLISEHITPFNIELSNPEGSYNINIESKSDYLIKLIINGMDYFNKNLTAFEDYPFIFSDISGNNKLFFCEATFPDKNRKYFASLNDILIEYINNSSNIEISRFYPLTKDFNKDLQSVILGIIPIDNYKHFKNLKDCQNPDTCNLVLNNYSDNHHADFNNYDSIEYLAYFEKQHNQYNEESPFLALSFNLKNAPENFSPDKFISELKKKSGLNKRSSFHFVTPTNAFVVYFSTNRKFSQQDFFNDLTDHLSTNKIKKHSLRYLRLEDYLSFFNQHTIIMTKKKVTTKKASKPKDKEKKAVEKSQEISSEQSQESKDQSKYPIAYGWENENKYDKDHPFYNFSIDKEKLSKLETDDHGYAHLGITLRKEPTEKGNCNVNIYTDDYHKTKQHNKYASLFASIKVSKVHESLKNSDNKYVSFSLGPVKDKDKFDYYIKLTNKELKQNEYVGSAITNKQCLIKSIPYSEKDFLGKASAKQFANGSISITVSVKADKLKNLELSPNGEYEISLGINRSENEIDSYANTFRKDSIIDLDKIVSLNINKEQLDTADVKEMNQLSFDLAFKKPESIKKDKFDMTCKVFKSADDKPYVGRAKTEANFNKDISQIISADKSLQKDQEKII